MISAIFLLGFGVMVAVMSATGFAMAAVIERPLRPWIWAFFAGAGIAVGAIVLMVRAS